MDIVKSGTVYSITDLQGEYKIIGDAIIRDTIELNLSISKVNDDDSIISTKGTARYTLSGINYSISKATQNSELSDLLYTKLKFGINKLINDYGNNQQENPV